MSSNKNIFICQIFILLFILQSNTLALAKDVNAYSGYKKNPYSEYRSKKGRTRDSELQFEFNAGRWLSKGDASWQKSFANMAGGTTASELSYKDIDSDITLLEAKVKGGVASFGLNLGFGDISGATGTDTDRATGVGTFSLSSFDVDGKTKLWGVTVYAHLLPYEYISNLETKDQEDEDFRLDLFAGYQHYEDKIRMFNGNQLEPATGPFANLNSTYDFKWDYFQLGLQSGWFIINPDDTGGHGLEINGSAGLIPMAWYSGEGNWNLRTDLAHPSFRHESTGRGADLNLALSYIYKQLKLSAGYRYLEIVAKNGTDTMYFSNGTSYRDNLDRVEIIRKGPFIELSATF